MKFSHLDMIALALAGFAAGWVYANRDTLLTTYRNRDRIAQISDVAGALGEVGLI